ncbi:hypothetical protein BD309DRAFT_945486 [Dichomitus squalens]|uniref:Uncharacterized protein n=1 Tax=Dichomitus squalens TaxID=114155 RepID=A0A4Q9Q7G7_9APHY|nr:uncharacterized protein DICSQDRAFT_144495 [Dichomitus squalens LYAD-421 SS1]EJF64757.1 hypothetical protein DICSQDRAFT_144495 [Dichomitus squalens LYAD-421 SS1]TBU33525.1 hypothetical protein BD311DRAFT_652654 [Dichomitus squalens]TBU50397.1 hypothetical protein BD309DRAFT_945486 [Dichomitus squalens]TBU62936.1 hypothetical protein BD310DRAFT_917453 [Dichomitus squalens]
MSSTPFRKSRHSLETFDKLFERAFAPRNTLDLTPLSLTDDVKRPTVLGPSPPSPDRTQFYSPVLSEFPIDSHEDSLDSIWDEVRHAKEVELASSPSKVKSLDGAVTSGSSQSPTLRPASGQQSPGRKRVAKKRSR